MHQGKRDELIVCAPEEGLAPLQAYLDASYLFAPFLGFPLRWVSLADRATDSIALADDLSLWAHPNDHLAPYRQWVEEMKTLPPRDCTFESYSIVLEGADRRLVYAGNLSGPGGSDELAPYCELCALLICELAHVAPEELGRFLAGRAIEQTVVSHFHPRWDGVPDAKILALIHRGAAGRGIRGAVSLARDGERFAC